MYKPIDDRQIINREALPNIGSPAGDNLADIFSRINAILAGASAASGYIAKQTPLTSGSTSYTVTIPSQPDISYVLLAIMGNLIDAHPQYQQVEVTNKATTGFTFTWNVPLDSANYFISYIVLPKSLSQSETSVGYGVDTVSISQNDSGISIAQLQNLIDPNPQFQPVVIGGSSSASSVTTKQYVSGSGVYTPSPGVSSIRVIVVGAGGGGGGTDGTAGNGGTTTFGSSFITCTGGSGGTAGTSNGRGGAGGTATIPSGLGGPGGFNGASGQGSNISTNSGGGDPGGMGGASPFGGAGSGSWLTAGTNAAANSGSGGGGGASSGTSTIGGGGGGAGGYADVIITNPATYAYSVGVAGTAGIGFYAGGTGGNGYIVIEESYGLNINSILTVEWNVPTDTANYTAASMTGGSGQVAIPNSATSVTVTLPVNYGVANYAIVASVQNTVDSNPQYQPLLITAETAGTATIGWNVPRDTGNYFLNWYAISLTP
jgi:hypothetical protein